MTAKVPGHKTDAEAFDGLRGTLAVWVAVGHFCLYSAWRNNLNNTFAMPFFFALSGFVLVEGYGRRRWARTTWAGHIRPSPTGETLPRLNTKRFLWRRLARLLPVYWLSNLLWVPLYHPIILQPSRIDHYANCRDWFAGDEAARISWGVITSVAMVTTWFPFPGSPGNFSDDAWFISTIVFCYLMFPSILPYLQEKSRKLQQYWLWAVYLVHMATVPMLIYFFHYVMGYSYRLNDGDGVVPAELCGNIIPTYEHPLFRLPQFAMGIIAALIRQAGPSLLGKEVDPSSVTDWSNIHMRWARVVDWWTLGYLVFLGLADPAAYLVIINTSTGFTSVLVMVFMSLTTMPFIVVLYGLTCDGGQSLLSRALRHSAAKWLGTVSYSLYLSHALIVGYFKLALFAASSAPPGCHDDSEDCVTQWNEWHASRQYPAWYALPMIAAALPLAYLVYVWVEEPARKLLVQAPDDITKCLSVEVQVATAPFTISSDCSGWGSFSSAIDDPPKPATSREPEDSQAQLLPDQTQS